MFEGQFPFPLLHYYCSLCFCPRQVHALPTGQGRRSRVLPLRFQGGRGPLHFETSGHGSIEAERFTELMRRLEAFSGGPLGLPRSPGPDVRF
jgi:hypothetical protein